MNLTPTYRIASSYDRKSICKFSKWIYVENCGSSYTQETLSATLSCVALFRH